MNLKEKKRMARFKIEEIEEIEIKELEIELNKLEPKLNPELKFKELIFKIAGLDCENE